MALGHSEVYKADNVTNVTNVTNAHIIKLEEMSRDLWVALSYGGEVRDSQNSKMRNV